MSDWDLEARQRISLVAMLHVLFRVDFEQAVGSVIFKEPKPDIYYAKAHGNVQLRPRCCLGPDRPRDEVTFLLRVVKKGGKLFPSNANDLASAELLRLLNGEIRQVRYRPMPPLDGPRGHA